MTNEQYRIWLNSLSYDRVWYDCPIQGRYSGWQQIVSSGPKWLTLEDGKRFSRETGAREGGGAIFPNPAVAEIMKAGSEKGLLKQQIIQALELGNHSTVELQELLALARREFVLLDEDEE